MLYAMTQLLPLAPPAAPAFPAAFPAAALAAAILVDTLSFVDVPREDSVYVSF